MNESPERQSPRRGWRAWRAALGPTVSLGLLALILLRLDLSELGAALAAASAVAWLVAITLFGAAIVVNSLRWHLAARSARLGVNHGLALRATLCGTFFNLLLFGPAGGDIAKSASYAHWYGLPLDRLLASAFLDRSFSAGGSLLFLLVAIGTLFTFGGWRQLVIANQDWQLNWIGPVLLLAVVIALGVLAWKRAGAWLHNLARTVRDAVRAVLRAPRVMALGCLQGFAQQLLMSGVFVACLAAMGQPDLPWLAMAWTFPLISAMAALPFTFGGAGAREGLALLLLMPYGVLAEAVVAAGLLTLGVYVAWAMIGAATAVLEWRRHASRGQPSGGRL